MTDMLDRAAIAIANYQRETPAHDRVSRRGEARAALLAAFDLTPEEIEAVSQEITGCMGSLNGRGTAARTVAALVTVVQKAQSGEDA